MKVVTPKEMYRIESLAYDAGCDKEAFMQKAGKGVAQVALHLIKDCQLGKRVFLLCGKGNNTGDAYVAGVDLLSKGYSVLAYQIDPVETCSELCQIQYQRFLNNGGFITDDPENIHLSDLIIDGIFGIGFHGIAEEPYDSIIDLANQTETPILSIDIPSGLDGESGKNSGPAIKASATAYLGLPKTGFFLDSGWNHVGTLRYVDFGLPQEYLREVEFSYEMLIPQMLQLPDIVANRHKYEAGEVMGVAGSPGMPGAAMLSSLAALRTGAGIVKLLYPEGMEIELSASPYELIRIPYTYEKTKELIEKLNHAAAAFIGPAIGRDEKADQFLREILDHLECPAVIDADALFLLGNHPHSIPKNCVLTPHTGECAKLLGNEKSRHPDETLIKQCQDYVKEHNTTLVLKGGPTFIFHPNTPIQICPRGTPALATAGSGDVLTGMIASLLSQGLSPLEAAKTGVYLHAAAGEDASKTETVYGMIASDIIDHLPAAFHEI